VEPEPAHSQAIVRAPSPLALAFILTASGCGRTALDSTSPTPGGTYTSSSGDPVEDQDSSASDSSSVSARDGEVSGGAQAADSCLPAAAGFALQFGGSPPQYVAISDAPQLDLTTFTVEAWMLEQDTTVNCVLCKPAGSGTNDSFAVWFQGPLYWGLNATAPNGAIAYSWSFAASTWHHIAGTYDAGSQTQQLFIDGVLVGSQSAQQPPSYDGHPLLIAHSADRDRRDRSMMSAQIGDGDHRSERSDDSLVA